MKFLTTLKVAASARGYEKVTWEALPDLRNMKEHAMLADHDAEYFTHRALSEMRTAAAADDLNIARTHLALSHLLLSRARAIVGDTLMDRARVISLNATTQVAAIA